MTDFLRINGIVAPVADGTPGLTQEDIGAFHRSVAGVPVWNRRAVKRKWSAKLAIKTAQEALAWRDLVTGKGHVVNFDALNFYSSKGLAPTSVAAGWSTTATSPKFGAGMGSWTTGNTLWPFFSSTSAWWVAWWLNQNAAGWHHYIQNSAGTKWIDGVLAPGGTMLGFGGVASGVATFGSTTASKLDDIVALPYLPPDDWAAQVYAFGNTDSQPFGALPRLTVDGSYIEQNSRLSVKGEPAELKVFQGYPSGSLVQNLHDFAFSLMEV